VEGRAGQDCLGKVRVRPIRLRDGIALGSVRTQMDRNGVGKFHIRPVPHNRKMTLYLVWQQQVIGIKKLHKSPPRLPETGVARR
jgi:hypothetical protein